MCLPIWEGRLTGHFRNALPQVHLEQLAQVHLACMALTLRSYSSTPQVLGTNPQLSLSSLNSHFNTASPEWTQQPLTPPLSSYAHGFIFYFLACWAQKKWGVTLTNSLPALQFLFFLKNPNLGSVQPPAYTGTIGELLEEILLLYKNYNTITMVIWEGWEKTISKLTIGYIKHFLSQESKLVSLGINIVKSRRQEAGPGEWEGRVKSQQSTTLSHKIRKALNI